MARVLLLTAADQAVDLTWLLTEEGHQPRHLPLLARGPLDDERGLQAAAEHAQRFRWILADGAPAVRAFLGAVARAGTRRGLALAQWLVADTPAGRLLERSGYVARVLGPAGWAGAIEGLVSDDEVLFLHEAPVPPAVGEALVDRGAHLTAVQACCAVPAPEWGEAPDVVIVHSPSAGEALCDAVGMERLAGVRLVASGPATAGAMRARGLPVHAVAAQASADGVLEATLRALSG